MYGRGGFRGNKKREVQERKVNQSQNEGLVPEENGIQSNNLDDPESRKSRYENRLSFYQELRNRPISPSKNRVAEDITFTIANVRLENDLFQTLEFDIMVRGNNPNNFFDNALFRIQYDPAVFGDSIVTNGFITISRGISYNTPTYTDPDLDVIDENGNTIGIPFGVDFNAPSLNRGVVPTIDERLLHISMDLNQCIDPSNIQFSDVSFTSLFSFYTTTASAPIVNGVSYDNTYYQGTPSTFSCSPQINFFTPTVYAGTYYPGTSTSEWKMRVEGDNFSPEPEVLFRNANDVNTFTFIDEEDYILKSDSVIEINMPSKIKISPTVPGSGRFLVINDYGDTVFTALGSTVQIPYALNNDTLIAKREKRRLNLADMNGLGGYTFHLDTSITNYPNPELMALVKKSVYEWSCSTGVNFQFGDTITDGGYVKNGESTIFLRNSLPNPSAYGTSGISFDFCAPSGSLDTIIYITDIDIGFLRSPAGVTWNFDSTGTSISANEADFFKVALHEVGHGAGLMHTINIPSGDLMLSGVNIGPISASQRLISITQGPLDGVFDMLDQSIFLQFQSTCLFSPQTHFEAFPPGCAGRGIPEFHKETRLLSVFPNPATEEVWVDVSEWDQQCEVSVFDAQGKVHLSVKGGRGTDYLYLGLSSLPVGIYFLKLVSGRSELGTAKLVLVR